MRGRRRFCKAAAASVAAALAGCDRPPPAATSAPAASVPASSPLTVAGLPGVTIDFATVDEGRAVLGAADAWTALSSPLQRAALMGRDPPVPMADFLAWQAAAVKPWNDAQRTRWRAALDKSMPLLARLKMPLPPRVLLVSTTGRESAETPHTRGAAVVLPERFDQQQFSDVEVLSHELYHVATRFRPDLATRLYATIGFRPCGDLQWPPEWEPIRIADHDAPHHRHFLPLTRQGRSFAVMPVVVAAKNRVDFAAGETIVALMQTRLLEVVPGLGGAPTKPLIAKGRPVWHDPESTPEYERALGGNTDYSIHPEETIADNLMFIVSGRKVPNPELLKTIEGVFVALPAKP